MMIECEMQHGGASNGRRRGIDPERFWIMQRDGWHDYLRQLKTTDTKLAMASTKTSRLRVVRRGGFIKLAGDAAAMVESVKVIQRNIAKLNKRRKANGYVGMQSISPSVARDAEAFAATTERRVGGGLS